MLRFVTFLSLALLVACQGKTEKSPKESAATPPGQRATAATQDKAAPTQSASAGTLSTPMARDIDRICNAEEQSGALELEGGRAVHVAQWLGRNIESEDGRTLLASLSKAAPKEKIALLRDSAEKNGLPGCPLVDAWTGAGSSTP